MTTTSSTTSSAPASSAVIPSTVTPAAVTATAAVVDAPAVLVKPVAADLVLVTPQGTQTLQAGQVLKVVAEPGRQYKLMRAAASADNVIATRQGNDLLLSYEGDTSVVLQGFYTAGQDGQVCSVLLPGESAEGHVLKGDSTGGVSNAEGATLVYAHGTQDALMAMAQGNVTLSDVFTSLGNGATLTYLPSSSAAHSADAAMPGADFNPASVLSILGAGALAVLGGGFSGSSQVGAASPDAPPPPPPPTKVTTISGSVVAGPVIGGNDLVIHAYTAAGAVLASGVAVDANGHYTLSYTSNYVGAVLLRISNGGSAPDYMDEALHAGKNLSSDLFSIVTVGFAGQAVTAHITPLTTLAAHKVGLNNTHDGISGDASTAGVAMLNQAIAKLFGVTNGNEQIVELLPTPVLSSTGAVQSGNVYGKLLAAISGAELALGQTTAQVITTLAAGMTSTASGLVFTNDAAGNAAKSALVQGLSQAVQTGVIATADMAQLATSILLNPDPAVAPQVMVYADAVRLNAPGHVGDKAVTAQVYFKLSVPSADFTRADITVTGGTLGALTVDASDPTLYHATFTANASDALTAQISVNGGTFPNARGLTNVPSIPFILSGDTLAPAAPTMSELGNGALADGMLSGSEQTISLKMSLPTSGAIAHAGESVALLLNGAALASPVTHILTAADIAAGFVTFSIDRLALGADGVKTLSTSIIDLAGNVSAAASQTFILDTSAPTLTVSAVTRSADPGNTTLQTISATLSGALSAGDKLEGSLDNGVSWTPITGMVSGTAISWTGVTLAGSSNIVFRVTDLAGNIGSNAGTTLYANPTTISGLLVAGPVIGGNDLVVNAYTADGAVLARAIPVGANGQYTFSYTTNYVGAVLLKVSSGGSAMDYMDEALRADKNLTSDVFGVVTVTFIGQSITAHITPLTMLAAQKLGVSSTQHGISGDASARGVETINNAIAKFFGLTTGGEQLVELLPTPVLSSTGAVQSSNVYGKVLAAFSGAELALGKTTEQVITTMADGITLTANGIAFSDNAAGNAAKNAIVQGMSRALQSGVLATADVMQLITNVLLNADPAAAPQVMVLADAVRLSAADNVSGNAVTAQVYFKLSVPSASFTLADITVTGGTLGALTVDASDPTLYHATFTANASDALTAQISVNAGTFLNARGITNVASLPFTLSGDTLAPGIPGVSRLDSGVLADGVLSGSEQMISLTVSLPTSGAMAHAGESVAVLLNDAALASPVTHILTAADIAAGFVTFSIDRLALGADGGKTLSARIIDQAGNASVANVAGKFLLDSTAVAPTVVLTTDSGASASDHITNAIAFGVGALEVASTSASGFSHLQYQVDGTSGAWTEGASGVTGVSSTVFAGAADGAHTLHVRQVDLAGNVSAITSRAFKLDTAAPGAPTVALTNDSGASSSDGITNTAAFSVGALEVLNASASGFDHFQYQLDGTTGAWLAGAPGVTNVMLAGATDGAHTVHVRQVDLAGNVSATTSQTFTLDTTAPVLTVSAVTLSVDTGTSAADHTTRTAAQTITATLSAALMVSDVLEGSLDNGASWVNLKGMVSGTAISWTGATLAGSSSIAFRVTDLAGNIGGITGATAYVLDTTPPASTVSAVTLSLDTGASATDHTTKSAAQTITATLSAALASGDILEGSLDNGATWSAITGMASGTAINWTGATLVGSALPGASAIVFRVTDLAGNVGSPSGTTAYVLDTTAPAPTVSAVTLSVDTGVSSLDHTTRTAAQTITATLSAALATDDVLEGSLDNGVSWVNVTGMVSGTAINWTGATLVGSNSIVFRVTDLAGNVASPTGTTAYVFDASAPVVNSVAISAGNPTMVAGDSILVSVVMSEAVDITGVPTYAIMLDSGPHLASYVSGSGSNTLVFSYTVAMGDSDLAGGVTASAGALLATGGATIADHAGNQASLAVAAILASANTVRVDTSAPAVRNAAVLDGQSSLEVTSDLVLDFGSALDAAVTGKISLVNDANTAAKAGFSGENVVHTIDMYFGARSSSNGVTTVQTYSSATTHNATTLSGSLSIVNATGVVTINPLHDLDLANNYHLEIAANSFTSPSNGLGNAAFGALTGSAYALDFSTVSPGAAGSGNAAVVMMDASALTAGHTWINITGMGDITSGTLVNVASAAGPTAYVIANQNTNPLDTVILADTTNVLLAGFRVGDMLYVDNSVNGRTSSLTSGSVDVSWTANATNDALVLDLAAKASFDAFIGISVTPFADVAAMNLRIDTLVSNHQIIVG